MPGEPPYQMTDRLFTPRFFLMCGFTFTVFLSAFQLLPTAPFRILSLGGSESVAGLFLGFLTYASAMSAPFTGALADRVGKRRILIVTSLAIAGFSATYAFVSSVPLMLGLVIVHGCFWSGLLTASGAYLVRIPPPERIATEVYSSDEDIKVQLGWMRFRSLSGEYHLGLARRDLHDRAVEVTLSPEDAAMVRRTTLEQVASLVRSVVGERVAVQVVFDEGGGA